MLNGHSEIEQIRRVSRFWAAIWWLGDVAYYSGFFALFGPLSVGGIYHRKAASLGEFGWRFGLLVLGCLACIPVGMAIGLTLKALSRRRTRVCDE